MSDRPFRPGSAWVAPKLYRFDGVPSSWEIAVLRPWPDPRAWRKTSAGDKWRGCRPPIDLGLANRSLPKRASRRTRNEREAALQVPPELRGPISRIGPNAQWAVLSMVARVDGALDLLRTTPSLATALAHSFRLRPRVRRPIRAARSQIRRRRREIAEWLGFPPTAAAVKALGKLEPNGDRPLELVSVFALRKLLLEGEPWLAHLSTLRPDVLALFLAHRSRRDRLTLRLLQEITALRSRSARTRASRQVFEVMANGPTLLPGGKVPVLRSLDRLRELVADLRERGQERHLAAICGSGPFPEPPYPDLLLAGRHPVQLRALTNAEALLAHARVQRNCLDTEAYYQPILRGTGYAFELTWPRSRGKRGRASLFVDACGLLHRRWAIHDLRLSCNRPPPKWLSEVATGLLRTQLPARYPPRLDPPDEPPPPLPERDERQLELPFLAQWSVPACPDRRAVPEREGWPVS